MRKLLLLPFLFALTACEQFTSPDKPSEALTSEVTVELPKRAEEVVDERRTITIDVAPTTVTPMESVPADKIPAADKEKISKLVDDIKAGRISDLPKIR